ncbi:MAG: hypothetical protein NTY17_12135, partial [Planctomycetia bacterium]|nr:hypothetical protein [Planctomycetia bacterium]
MASSISVLASLPRFAVAGGLFVAACATPLAAQLPSQRFEKLANEALQATETFRPAGDAALGSAAAGLRQALVPLDTLLNRSKSGDAWRTYLDWPALQTQAASGVAADPATLRRLEELLNATETGLDMPEFVRVRKAVTRYAEVADAARGNGASRMSQRLGSLASSLLSASATGSAESLAPVPPILERLAEAGQAPDVVAAVRGANARPNILLEVHESLLAQAVNRPIDQVMPVDEVVLGTRVRGSGRTRGNVRLDFVPSSDRAAFDLVFAATNVADTRGSQGPVTVNSREFAVREAADPEDRRSQDGRDHAAGRGHRRRPGPGSAQETVPGADGAGPRAVPRSVSGEGSWSAGKAGTLSRNAPYEHDRHDAGHHCPQGHCPPT